MALDDDRTDLVEDSKTSCMRGWEDRHGEQARVIRKSEKRVCVAQWPSGDVSKSPRWLYLLASALKLLPRGLAHSLCAI